MYLSQTFPIRNLNHDLNQTIAINSAISPIESLSQLPVNIEEKCGKSVTVVKLFRRYMR